MNTARFIYDWFGVGNHGQPNVAYSFWSGVGSCLGYVAAVPFLVKHFTCHVSGCYRMGRHHIEEFKVCTLHHPGIDGTKITPADIIDAHERVI